MIFLIGWAPSAPEHKSKSPIDPFSPLEAPEGHQHHYIFFRDTVTDNKLIAGVSASRSQRRATLGNKMNCVETHETAQSMAACIDIRHYQLPHYIDNSKTAQLLGPILTHHPSKENHSPLARDQLTESASGLFPLNVSCDRESRCRVYPKQKTRLQMYVNYYVWPGYG